MDTNENGNNINNINFGNDQNSSNNNNKGIINYHFHNFSLSNVSSIH